MYAMPFWGKNCVYNNKDCVIAISSTNHLKIFKISFKGGKAVITDDTPSNLPPFDVPVIACAISSDGNSLLVATQKNFQIFNLLTNQFTEIEPINYHSDYISQCCYLPGYNNFFITASLDRTLKIWDVDLNMPLQTLTARDFLLCVTVSPDAKSIVAGTHLGDIYIWTQTNDCWSQLPIVKPLFERHSASINCCVFSPDGSKMVSTAADQTLIVWNTHNWSILYHVKYKTAITCCVFSDDNHVLYLGGIDGSIQFWNLYVSQNLIITKLGQHIAATITDCFFSASHQVLISRSRSNNALSVFKAINVSQPPAISADMSCRLEPIQLQKNLRSRPTSPNSTPMRFASFHESPLVAALVDHPRILSMHSHIATSISFCDPPLSPAHPSTEISELDTATFVESPSSSAPISPNTSRLMLGTALAITPPPAGLSPPSNVKAVPGSSPLRYAAENSARDTAVAKRLFFEPALPTPHAASASSAMSQRAPEPALAVLRGILRPDPAKVRATRELSFSTTQDRGCYEAYLLGNQAAQNGLLENQIMAEVEEVRADQTSTLAAQIITKKEIPSAHGGVAVSYSAISLYTKRSFFTGISKIYIVATGGDTEIRRWNLEPKNKKPVKTMTGHKAFITCCGISDDAKFIYSGDQTGGIRIRESTGWNAWGLFTVKYFAPKPPNNAIMTKDNEYLLYTMSTATDEQQFPIEFVRRTNEQKVCSVVQHTDVITSMVWLNESLLITSSLDRSICIWDLKPTPSATHPYARGLNINPICLKKIVTEYRIARFAVSYVNVNNSGRGDIVDEVDCKVLAYACVPENSAQLFLLVEKDRETGIQVLKTLNAEKKITACAFSNNGLLLLTGHDDGTIIIWEVKTGNHLSTKRNHYGPIQSLAFSADSSLLISTSSDGKVVIWDTQITTLADEALKLSKAYDD